jgi:hypothetical protein
LVFLNGGIGVVVVDHTAHVLHRLRQAHYALLGEDVLTSWLGATMSAATSARTAGALIDPSAI